MLGDFVTEAGSTNNVGGVNGNGAAVAAGDDDKGDEQGAQTEEHEENGQRVVEEVDVWVTSEYATPSTQCLTQPCLTLY